VEQLTCGLMLCVQRCLSDRRWLNASQIQTGTSQISHNVVSSWTEMSLTKAGWTTYRYKLEHHRLATVWSGAEQCVQNFDLHTKEGPRHGFGNYVSWYILESLFSLILQRVGGWVKNRLMDVSWHFLSCMLRGNDIVTSNKTWFHHFTPESNTMG